MTGKEKSAVCSAVARGIAKVTWGDSPPDEAVRQEIALAIGAELEQVLGCGFGGDTMLVRLDVVRMMGEA